MAKSTQIIKQYWYLVKNTVFRKWFFISLLFIIGFIAIMNAPWISIIDNLDTQPLDKITLKGDRIYTQEEDIQDALERMGGLKSFLAQDTQQIKNQLAQLSWIKTLVVHKQWPDSLYLWVQDYQPIAMWNGNNFLADDGTIFSLPPDKNYPSNLPNLNGPNNKTQLLLSVWNAMSAQLQQQHLILKKLYLTDRGAWTAIISNGMVLKLGSSNWENKLANFSKIYPNIEIPADKKIAYVDLRYPSGAAVKLIDSDSNQSENKK
ncbi:cell division protein FtsQ/DivIB [Actinobacillus delphinicola]|uniref:Cell division protein FtsQ n=1 Tax=Actinobacillus delphinicola TaxID=51161 RepID=A0A448TUS1_9PAST|nr:cell division protein FtsQ/DivIB [Actinobacillus delphinicola]VEJ09603.1 cell division protein FtsQ [Actinobacillus delphinicola]